MIIEDYVSFETAKLLKEKGFKGLCTAYYDCFTTKNFHDGGEPTDYNSIDPKIRDIISAPTLQMAMKWLVREYKLYVNVAPSVEGYYWTDKWHSYVENLNKRYPFGRFISTFNSYEEACEAATKYCLEHLI